MKSMIRESLLSIQSCQENDGNEHDVIKEVVIHTEEMLKADNPDYISEYGDMRDLSVKIDESDLPQEHKFVMWCHFDIWDLWKKSKE